MQGTHHYLSDAAANIENVESLTWTTNSRDATADAARNADNHIVGRTKPVPLLSAHDSHQNPEMRTTCLNFSNYHIGTLDVTAQQA